MVNEKTDIKLWDKIKDLPMDIFALPNQTIKDHAKHEEGMDDMFPNAIFLTLNSTAAYPALEEALVVAQARHQIKLDKTEKF